MWVISGSVGFVVISGSVGILWFYGLLVLLWNIRGFVDY